MPKCGQHSSLHALSRIENARGRMPATGWQQRFEGANLTLHLPAGQRLLDARGVDDAPGTWLHDWRLLDLPPAATPLSSPNLSPNLTPNLTPMASPHEPEQEHRNAAISGGRVERENDHDE